MSPEKRRRRSRINERQEPAQQKKKGKVKEEKIKDRHGRWTRKWSAHENLPRSFFLILIESQEEKSRTPEDEGQRGRLEVIPGEKGGGEG